MYTAKKIKGRVWDVYLNGQYAGTAYNASSESQAIKIIKAA